MRQTMRFYFSKFYIFSIIRYRSIYLKKTHQKRLKLGSVFKDANVINFGFKFTSTAHFNLKFKILCLLTLQRVNNVIFNLFFTILPIHKILITNPTRPRRIST